MPTWNSSDHVVLPRFLGGAVLCRPHAGRYGYGHALEAVVVCALQSRRRGATLRFVPTGAPADGITRVHSRQVRVAASTWYTRLLWSVRAAGVACARGGLAPSALVWRLVEAARLSSIDGRRTKRARHVLKEAVRLARRHVPRLLERGKLAVRRTAVVRAPRLSEADWAELADRPLDLRLLPGADREGERRARAAGIPVDAPLVTVHVRHAGYKTTVGFEERPVDRVRASDIRSYVPAFRRLVERGYVVVRLGDPSAPAIEMAGVVDLAHSAEACPLLDVWVSQRSRFMMICDSGPSLLTRLADVPCLGVNVVDLRTAAVKPIDRFICKRPIARDGQAMSLAAMLDAGILGASEALDDGRAGRPRVNAAGYAYTDNTADEIVDVVDEMVSVVTAARGPEPIQTTFSEMLARAAQPGFAGRGHIGASFARTHLGCPTPVSGDTIDRISLEHA